MDPLAPTYDPFLALGAPWPSPKKAKNSQNRPFSPLLPHRGTLPKFCQSRGPGAKKSKNFFLFKIIIYDSPEVQGVLKTQNWPSGPPGRPLLGPVRDHFGPFWTQKTRFFRKKNFRPNDILGHPGCFVTPKNPKLTLYDPI